MSAKRYPEEFKLAAVRQISEGGYAVSEVAKRLDVTIDSLYAWVKKYGPGAAAYQTKNAEQAELTQLRKELKRVTEERDLLKKSRGILRKTVQVRYAFIKDHQDCWPTR